MGEMPFIGAKISLISKGDIRYEGTLYSIDMNESTIALQNVKSFGTENRRPENFLPPSDEIYEYIIFKGADIKDLAVLQNVPPPGEQPAPAEAPPQPLASQPAPEQPAPSPWGPPQPQQQYGNAQWGAAPAPRGAPAPYYTQTPAAPNSQAAQQQTSDAKAPSGVPPAQPPTGTGRPGPAPAPTVLITPAAPARGPRPPPPQQQRGPPGLQQQPQQAPAAAQEARANGPQPGRELPNGVPQRQAPSAPGPAAPRPRPTSFANAAGGGRGRGRGPPGAPPGIRGGRTGGRSQPPRAPPVPVPAEDFNFEEAFQKFKKEEVLPEVEKAVEPQKKVYSKDDFFDSLSCDALERLNVSSADGGPPPEKPQARTRFAEQRKLDIETFGGTGIARRNNYGRGRGGRGRHGGGGGRGGGGRENGRGRGTPAAAS